MTRLCFRIPHRYASLQPAAISGDKMKRLLVALCCTVGLVLVASPAARAQFYIGAHGGANFVPDSDIDGSGVDAEASADPGFAAGAVAGYRLGLDQNLSLDLEGEFTYRQNDIDQFSAAGFAAEAGGEIRSFAWMANAWLNWQIGDSGFAPYVGGGFGGVHIDINDGEVAGIALDEESDFVIGGQLGGGLGYQLDEHLVLSVDYRFLITDDADFQGLDVSYQSHSVLLGVAYLC
jgi:opacity protein-like surface antigen